MSLDFSPAPGPSSFGHRARAQSLIETRLMLRNGEQLLLAVVIPILTLVGGVFLGARLSPTWAHRPVDLITPGVLALAVMSTSFTSLAIATGFERRAGLLRRLAVSPLSLPGLLLGKIGALLAVEVVQIAILGVTGWALGWRPNGLGLLMAAVVAVIGTFSFAGLGLAVAGSFRAEATLAIANLLNLLFMIGGMIVLPRSALSGAPEWLRFLPSAALGDAMRAALIDGLFAWQPLAILLGWSLVGAAAAARWFSWD